MVDKYKNYSDLASHENKGIDYDILFRDLNTRYAIVAPHGGYIEHGTKQISDAIAEEDHAWYCFAGLQDHCHRLHITSNNFDEPIAIRIANQVDTVISIHGAYGKEPKVFFGGLDGPLKQTFIDALLSEGFDASHDSSPTRQGKGLTNICNRGKLKQGVQIEMTQGFRKSLFHKPDYDNHHWRPNDRFRLFVRTIRSVLDNFSNH